VLCQLIPPRRPLMQFLFIGSRLSPSLPPHGRSPFRSWLQLVFSVSWFHFHRGLEPLRTVPMLGTHKAIQLTLDPDIVVDAFRRESIVLLSFGSCHEGS